MRDIEGSWEYDKHKSETYYIEKQRAAEKQRGNEVLVEGVEEKAQDVPESVAEDAGTNAEDDDFDFNLGGDDDDGGGLFGNMMDMEVSETPTAPSSKSVTSWTHVDLSIPKSWKGRSPCDILREHCKKHTNYSRQVYTSKELGTRTWRATVRLIPEGKQQEPVLVDIPSDYVTSSAKDAENLAAVSRMVHHSDSSSINILGNQTAALFHLDPDSSSYRILPPAFKDIWFEWDGEKVCYLGSSVIYQPDDLLIETSRRITED